MVLAVVPNDIGDMEPDYHQERLKALRSEKILNQQAHPGVSLVFPSRGRVSRVE